MRKREIEKMLKELKDALAYYMISIELIKNDIEKYEKMLGEKHSE